MSDKVFVKDLDDAYEKGYFSGSMNRQHLIECITKRNPEIRVIYNKEGAGLFNVRNGFICGISRLFSIPQFTLIDEDSKKVLCRSWKKIIKIVRREGYEINESDLF